MFKCFDFNRRLKGWRSLLGEKADNERFTADHGWSEKIHVKKKMKKLQFTMKYPHRYSYSVAHKNGGKKATLARHVPSRGFSSSALATKQNGNDCRGFFLEQHHLFPAVKRAGLRSCNADCCNVSSGMISINIGNSTTGGENAKKREGRFLSCGPSGAEGREYFPSYRAISLFLFFWLD